MNRVVYLHGFASSPQSSKARLLGRELRARGVEVDIPQLDGGHFETLTITGQLAVIQHVVSAGRGPVVLLGSSLGGYLAALFAARYPEAVEKLVLMAPAFQFPSRWRQSYTAAELEAWREAGSAPVFHYGANRLLQLGYGFLEDSASYEDEPDARQPALIFHGTRDKVVPPEVSRQFCASHPQSRLELLDSGHELTDVVAQMWELTWEFMQPLC